MLAFLRKNAVPTIEKLPPLEILLTNIQRIGKSGILYADNQGNLALISYKDAYKGWCRSKKIRSAALKYICDRSKNNGWRLIFYTEPQIIFCAEPADEKLWIDIMNKLTLRRYPAFDWN